MFNSKLYRVLFQVGVLIYLTSHIVSFSSIGQTTTPKSYTQEEANAKDLARLEGTISSLNLQQRLTSLEEITKVNARDIEKLVGWQDKFQWALIALLAESIWRLYDQFKSKGR
jgi:hypothetical protein